MSRCGGKIESGVEGVLVRHGSPLDVSVCNSQMDVFVLARSDSCLNRSSDLGSESSRLRGGSAYSGSTQSLAVSKSCFFLWLTSFLSFAVFWW